MYQTQYARPPYQKRPESKLRLEDHYAIHTLRHAIWEEHCLECSAPGCYAECSHYISRQDGRCQRFYNSIELLPSKPRDLCQVARVQFRPWGNLLTVAFDAYKPVPVKRSKSFLDRLLHFLVMFPIPIKLKWLAIRILEYLRRRYYKMLSSTVDADAFVLHVYNESEQSFQLFLESSAAKDHRSLYRTSFSIAPGENILVLPQGKFPQSAFAASNTIKIFPENNLEVSLVFFFLGFVQGSPAAPSLSADHKVKCIVWDLDNTIWDGTLMEAEQGALSLRPQIFEAIKEADRRGILQSIASKNDYDPAWAELERLGISEYFLFPQLSWGRKSASIQKIAASLNIGIDAFAFADDSVFERNEVQAMLPQVRIYDEASILEALHTEPFNMEITVESKMRRSMYMQEAQRTQILSQDDMDISSFLREAAMTIELFTPATAEEISRCFEIVQRTNQLNISGKKYAQKPQFEMLFAETGKQCVAFSCHDKFGDYGIVCFCQYAVLETELHIHEFAMSCRVAGKHIESNFFAYLLQKEQASRLFLPIMKTEKNSLIRRTLSELKFDIVSEDQERVIFTNSANMVGLQDVIVRER